MAVSFSPRIGGKPPHCFFVHKCPSLFNGPLWTLRNPCTAASYQTRQHGYCGLPSGVSDAVTRTKIPTSTGRRVLSVERRQADIHSPAHPTSPSAHRRRKASDHTRAT